MFALLNRTWLIYAALAIFSILGSAFGQNSQGYGTNDRSSEEVDLTGTGELNPTVAGWTDASNDSKSVLLRIDTMQKELALCSATLMAVETREKMLKEQSLECDTIANELSNDKAKIQSLEYAQRIQQLERSLQMDRELMQLKMSRYTLMMNQYQEELLRTNQLLRLQNENYRQQIVRVQDELFTLRYEYHRINEAQRQKQMSLYYWYDALQSHVGIPILDWLRDPFWDRILYPHAVVPLKKSAKQTFIVAREYFDQYSLMLRRRSEAAVNSIFLEYVEPASHWIQRFLQTNPQVVKLWILVGEISEKSREWFRVNGERRMLPVLERLRIELRWAYQTLSDVLLIVGSTLEQRCRSKWRMSQGTGPHIAIYNVVLSIVQSTVLLSDGNESLILVMTVLLLVYLIRKRWRRYLE
jgi:hypothetical protein